MRSGSVNVMCITFGGFTLLTHFYQLFEVLTAPGKQVAGRIQQPIVPKALHQSRDQSQPAGL
jgi:hypothetical protein